MMPRQLDRRCWLQRSTGALAALPAIGVWSETRSNDSPNPEKQLRIGAIGVGNRGASNVASLAAEEIVALCDVDQQLIKHTLR